MNKVEICVAVMIMFYFIINKKSRLQYCFNIVTYEKENKTINNINTVSYYLMLPF